MLISIFEALGTIHMANLKILTLVDLELLRYWWGGRTHRRTEGRKDGRTDGRTEGHNDFYKALEVTSSALMIPNSISVIFNFFMHHPWVH